MVDNLKEVNQSDLFKLLVTSTFIGLSYGVCWTSIPVLINEYFGVKKFATHWGWMTLLPAVGGQICSTVFGYIYDKHRISIISDGVEQKGKCYGRICFQFSYM
ncbi:hypothetical protein HK099_001311, partial [Clydaea vesicula]